HTKIFRPSLHDALPICELPRIGRVDHRCPAQAALPLGRLAVQDVLLERLAPQKLSALGALEALGGAAVRFQFRHLLLTLNTELRSEEHTSELQSPCNLV